MAITRRDALLTMGSGFGMTAFAGMLGANAVAKGPHFPAKAKRVIFLFLNGGPSHVDTFDPKPALDKYDGKPVPDSVGPIAAAGHIVQVGNLMKSPFSFKRYGQSGTPVSELFAKVGECIDDVCVIRSVYSDIPNHPQGLFMMNCGHSLAGRPALGSWLLYGLGTENHNLPGFVVLAPGLPIMAPQIWNSAFLPTSYQGTWIQNNEPDSQKLIPYSRNTHETRVQQQQKLDLLGKLNRLNLQQQGPTPQLEASIEGMETAFRMQTEGVDAFDIGKETEATRAAYGDGEFARGCLMARRLVERGVRMVQVYFGAGQPWDSHSDIMEHRKLGQQSDQPIAALLRDLKSRGMLDDTLVMIGGEFGRTPAVEAKGSTLQNGRDHNSDGFTMLLAGGGVKAGTVYGGTDEFGFKAVDKPMHVHDLHASILHLCGFDHTKLTYRYSGRDFRLTDVSGNVVKEIMA
ncbi:MAG: DUF1501 domain-containing protein [Bryobacteraceae bacterium]